MSRQTQITSRNVTAIDAPKSPQIARIVPFLGEQKIAHTFARIEIPYEKNPDRTRDVVEVLILPVNEKCSAYTFVSNRMQHYGPIEATHSTDLVEAFNANAHRII